MPPPRRDEPIPSPDTHQWSSVGAADGLARVMSREARLRLGPPSRLLGGPKAERRQSPRGALSSREAQPTALPSALVAFPTARPAATPPRPTEAPTPTPASTAAPSDTPKAAATTSAAGAMAGVPYEPIRSGEGWGPRESQLSPVLTDPSDEQCLFHPIRRYVLSWTRVTSLVCILRAIFNGATWPLGMRSTVPHRRV